MRAHCEPVQSTVACWLPVAWVVSLKVPDAVAWTVMVASTPGALMTNEARLGQLNLAPFVVQVNGAVVSPGTMRKPDAEV